MLCLFDVDGTLTAPRSTISPALLQFLETRVAPLAALGLVSGSDFPKVAEQLGGAHVAARFSHVFCENGLVRYRRGVERGRGSIVKELGEERLQRLVNSCLARLARIQLPAKRGHFVELRAGLLNVSPVGRGCSREERRQFAEHDATHGVREQLVRELREEFAGEGLQFALGGEISVDIFPLGWDKTYCLGHLEEPYDTVHFFGDKTAPGGNDHEIYSHPRTVGHAVVSPVDTEHQLRDLFSLHNLDQTDTQ